MTTTATTTKPHAAATGERADLLQTLPSRVHIDRAANERKRQRRGHGALPGVQHRHGQMLNATPEQAQAGMELWMQWAVKAADAIVDGSALVEDDSGLDPASRDLFETFVSSGTHVGAVPYPGPTLVRYAKLECVTCPRTQLR